MSDAPTEAQSNADGSFFRPLIGILALLGGLAGFAGLYLIEVPAGNKDAMMFALGIIFNWGSNVIASEYGATTTGRKVADSAIRGLERQSIAAEEKTPAGTPDDPLSVAGAVSGKKPVQTKDARS